MIGFRCLLVSWLILWGLPDCFFGSQMGEGKERVIKSLPAPPALAGGSCPSLPGLLIPANACPHGLRCCRARGLYTDPLFIGRLRARMSLGHIPFCPGSSHLGCKQGGKEKGEREMRGGDRGRATCAEGLLCAWSWMMCLRERLHWTDCSRSPVSNVYTCVSSVDMHVSEIGQHSGQQHGSRVSAGSKLQP